MAYARLLHQTSLLETESPQYSYQFEPTELTWEEHNKRAMERNGIIATISCSAENDCVVREARERTVWIGAKRLHSKSQDWEWSDGTPFEFENWAPGEPNNCGGIENRVHMCGNGQWNDVFAGNDFSAGWIGPAVYQFKQDNGSILYECASDSLSWEEHNWNAIRRGGSLASIASAGENALVAAAARGETVWIGTMRRLQYISSEFEWVDGTTFAFQNWAPGEPNNCGGKENRIQMCPNGTWNDVNESWEGPAVYKFRTDERPIATSVRPGSGPGSSHDVRGNAYLLLCGAGEGRSKGMRMGKKDVLQLLRDFFLQGA